jgi:predicted phosphodiesterase
MKYNDKVHFYFIGDAHYGSKSFDETLFKETIKHIAKDPYGYVFLMGDLCECIPMGDKRFDPRNVAKECLPHLDNLGPFQADRMGEMLEPIAERVICVLDGNHEDTFRRSMQVDISQRLIVRLQDAGGIPKYGSDIAAVRILLSYKGGKTKSMHHRQVVFLLTHGFGSGRTKGSKLNRLMELPQILNADIYVMAHHHDKVLDRVNYFELGAGRGNNKLFLIEKKRLLGCTGAFYKTYLEGTSNYASKRLYRPGDLGAIYAEVVLRHPIHHSVSMTLQDLLL